ncbi:hypothetical protein D3C78_1148610 [compost metagenome]
MLLPSPSTSLSPPNVKCSSACACPPRLLPCATCSSPSVCPASAWSWRASNRVRSTALPLSVQAPWAVALPCPSSRPVSRSCSWSRTMPHCNVVRSALPASTSGASRRGELTRTRPIPSWLVCIPAQTGHRSPTHSWWSKPFSKTSPSSRTCCARSNRCWARTSSSRPTPRIWMWIRSPKWLDIRSVSSACTSSARPTSCAWWRWYEACTAHQKP